MRINDMPEATPVIIYSSELPSDKTQYSLTALKIDDREVF
jgi:hypothetical protein